MANSLMKQTFLLMIASLIARLLGLVYQTLLSRSIGPQGLGLYQMSFTVFIIALTLASAGLSQSLSKITSELLANNDTKNARKNFNIALTLVAITSTTICVFTFIFAPKLALYIYDDLRLVLPFRILTIAIFSVAISQVFQGYFQGHKNMLPTATSQILEQVVRIISIPLIVVPFLPKGVALATSAAIFGMAIAEFSGLIVLLLFFLFSRKSKKTTNNPEISSPLLLKSLLFIALPIGFGSLVSTINYSFSTIIIPKAMITAGYSKEFAIESLGYYSGMAMPLLFLPTVFTFPLAISLIPGVSEALATGNENLLKQRISLATKFSITLGFYVLLILRIYNEQLPFFIFGYKNPGPMINVLAVSAIFLYPQQIFTSILHGLGKPTQALRNLIIITAVNLILLFFLVTKFGIVGSAYTFIIVNIVAFVLDLATISSTIYIKVDLINWYIKPILAVITSYKIATTFLSTSSFVLKTTIFNLFITSFFFFITLLLSTTFNKNELTTFLKVFK